MLMIRVIPEHGYRTYGKYRVALHILLIKPGHIAHVNDNTSLMHILITIPDQIAHIDNNYTGLHDQQPNGAFLDRSSTSVEMALNPVHLAFAILVSLCLVRVSGGRHLE